MKKVLIVIFLALTLNNSDASQSLRTALLNLKNTLITRYAHRKLVSECIDIASHIQTRYYLATLKVSQKKPQIKPYSLNISPYCNKKYNIEQALQARWGKGIIVLGKEYAFKDFPDGLHQLINSYKAIMRCPNPDCVTQCIKNKIK